MNRLTEKDLLILEMLSDDCGHPLWELSENIEWDKVRDLPQKPPNIRNWIRSAAKGGLPNLKNRLKKLEQSEFVYTFERKYSTRWGTRSPGKHEYPYYINKNLGMFEKIQRAIADPEEGTIWKYDKIERDGQREFDKLKRGRIMKCEEAPPTPDGILEARRHLLPLIHLYWWCDAFIEHIRKTYQSGLARGDFSLLTPIPPCARCQESQRWMNIDQAHQNRMRLIGEENKCMIEIKARRQYGLHSYEFINPVYPANLTPDLQLRQQPP